MADFTLKTYGSLIAALSEQDYRFVCFNDYLSEPSGRVVILRHDVDRLPENSLRMALQEHASGIRGTYYFRIVPSSFDLDVIRKIHSLGHEIGYHYEDLVIVSRRRGRIREEELVEAAIESFSANLEKLRKVVPVTTICMHGSPLSRYDSKLLWKYHDYRKFGINGEPYLDTDWNRVLYLTDTGRRWNGNKFNVRDRTGSQGKQSGQGNDFHSTSDIIRAVTAGRLPDRIMITLHPQRWTDDPLPWMTELAGQTLRNIIKYFLITIRR